MDISVRDERGVVWCIEVKERGGDLDAVAAEVARHGANVDFSVEDRDNDGLRKAKYLLQFRPTWFTLLAIGRRLDFEVSYESDTQFGLRPDLVPLG